MARLPGALRRAPRVDRDHCPRRVDRRDRDRSRRIDLGGLRRSGRDPRRGRLSGTLVVLLRRRCDRGGAKDDRGEGVARSRSRGTPTATSTSRWWPASSCSRSGVKKTIGHVDEPLEPRARGRSLRRRGPLLPGPYRVPASQRPQRELAAARGRARMPRAHPRGDERRAIVRPCGHRGALRDPDHLRDDPVPGGQSARSRRRASPASGQPRRASGSSPRSRRAFQIRSAFTSTNPTDRSGSAGRPADVRTDGERDRRPERERHRDPVGSVRSPNRTVAARKRAKKRTSGRPELRRRAARPRSGMRC